MLSTSAAICESSSTLPRGRSLFGGLTLEEAGQVLGFTERTAKRYWAFARAWLYKAIRDGEGGKK